jgi:GGDEF domain-containing protein
MVTVWGDGYVHGVIDAADCASRISTPGGRAVIALRRRRTRRDDHYYWLTAYLAAHNAQAFTCRLNAALIATTGLIPTLLLATPQGPHSPASTLISVSITACCIAMAALWLRPRWPSRLQSQLCVVVGSLCIAVACLIQPDPVFGLLGSNVFAIAAAFVAFFHSLRLLLVTWLVGAATLIALAVRLSEINTGLATVGVLLVALVNVFAVFVCRMVIRLIDNQIRHNDLEPLTGLLNRDAFYDQVATLIGARNRAEDRYLAVALVSLDNYSALLSLAGAAGANRARGMAAQRLRGTVRREAILAHVSDAEFLIADVFTTRDPTVLIERIRGVLAGPPSRLTASIGTVSVALRPLVSHPPHDVLDELLAIATAAMNEARGAGGNQHRLILDPNLTVVDKPCGNWPDNWPPT